MLQPCWAVVKIAWAWCHYVHFTGCTAAGSQLQWPFQPPTYLKVVVIVTTLLWAGQSGRHGIAVVARFSSPCPDRPWGWCGVLYVVHRPSFVGVKQLGHDIDPHHLAPRLKKEWSYTFTSWLGLHGRLWGELLTLYFAGYTATGCKLK
jgi:hypothetical protein